jgi:hypothetical protein
MNDRGALLEDLLDALADAVANRVVDRLRSGATAGMVDQAGSSLGRRRHIEAVRRRVAAGEPGAVQLGRRYLLTQAALEEEARRIAARPTKRTRRDELLARYGLEVAQ